MVRKTNGLVWTPVFAFGIINKDKNIWMLFLFFPSCYNTALFLLLFLRVSTKKDYCHMLSFIGINISMCMCVQVFTYSCVCVCVYKTIIAVG